MNKFKGRLEGLIDEMGKVILYLLCFLNIEYIGKDITKPI